MKQSPIAIGLLVALLTSPSSFAANPNSAELMLQSQQRLSSMRESLGLDENHSFQFQSVDQDQLGQTHVRFQQLYRGIRIWGGEVITHTLANQKELPLTTVHKQDIQIGIEPKLSDVDVLAIVKKDIAPRVDFTTKPLLSKGRMSAPYREQYSPLLSQC
ncbi:MAG: hypothetical protein CTY13_05905 [Methylobacter sp.]|nr:MAG: hypothetical protein CTY13_05905 [Methylobacter sp.]